MFTSRFFMMIHKRGAHRAAHGQPRYVLVEVMMSSDPDINIHTDEANQNGWRKSLQGL